MAKKFKQKLKYFESEKNFFNHVRKVQSLKNLKPNKAKVFEGIFLGEGALGSI